MGEDDDDEDEEQEGDKQACAGAAVVLGKDAQELRVVLALAFMQMKKHKEALAVWRRLAAFACHHCPPFDESIPVYATQAALCAIMLTLNAEGSASSSAITNPDA